MLYDSSRAGNLTVDWFSSRYWESLGAVQGRTLGVRASAQLIEAQGQRMVLRHYHRGGAAARVSSRHYLWRGEDRTRPFREWQLTYRMHRAGLPVPAPIGALYQRRLGTYTGDLLLERLATRSLLECLTSGTLSLLTWIAIGRCIRRFHDFGVWHADLNVRNVLVAEDKVYLIDFDRCRLRGGRGLWRDSNLVRLRRSLEKVTYSLPKDRFTEADWYALLDGYRQPDAAQASAPAAGPVAGLTS